MARGWFGGAALAALLAGACSGGAPGGSAAEKAAGFTRLPESAASEAGVALGATGDGMIGIEEAVAATRKVLRTAGIKATPMQELVYAMDMRHKPYQGRLDSAQVAQMLQTFGWKFPGLDPNRPVDRDDPAVPREERDQVRAAEKADAQAQDDALQARGKAIDARYEDMIRALREEFGRTADYAQGRKVRTRIRELEDRRNAERRALYDERRTEQTIARLVGRDDAAGRQLMAFLADWVRGAAADPDDPANFAPLFLAEMARRQSRPIDLAAQPHPREHSWTLLELSVFASAFHPPRQRAANPVALVLDALVPAAHAGSPCEVAKEAWGDWGDAAEWANGELTGNVLDQAFSKHFGDAGLGDVLGATAILGKVVKLAAFYSTAQVTVKGDVEKMHKPDTPFKFVFYTATAGVDPEELKAYEELSKKAAGMDKALRDCLGWGGIADVDSIKDVAEDAERWLLDWRLHADPADAIWAPRDQQDAVYKMGRWAVPMKRVSASSVEAKFVVRVKSEGSGRHSGPLGNSKVVVSAEVDSSGMPALSTFINAAKGVMGIADSLVELAAGWTRVVFKPQAQAVLDLEFHCPNPTTVHSYVRNPVAWGNGEGGGGCTFAFGSKQEYEQWRDGWEGE